MGRDFATQLGAAAAASAALAIASFAADRTLPDREFAARLWTALAAARMVGEDATRTRPYEGGQPHGGFVDFQDQEITVAGRSARAIVKRNYEGGSVREIWADPRRHLVSVTVMFRREPGYDPATNDWFWAKYGTTGAVEAAGSVGECIACHGRAKANDYILSYPQSR